MHLRTLLPFLLATSLAAAQSGTRERGRFSLQGDPATYLAIDPAVKHVLIAFNAGSVCVFPADQRVVNVYSHPVHKKTVTGAAFLPDGEHFVTVSLDGTLKTWETAAALKYLKQMEDKNGDAKPELPKPTHAVTAHSGHGVTCVAVSPDGKRFATGATDGTVKLWDADAVKQTASLAAVHQGGVKAVQFSPDGKVLASGGADKTAKLWDLSTAKPTLIHNLDGHDGPVNAVAFSPDGKLLAAGTGVPKKSGVVQVWDATTGKPAYKLEGHEDVVTCVVFHPKTNHLASGGADKKIRVWDLAEKKTLYSDEHSEPLKALVISPDGVRFGSCSAMAVRWWAGFGN
jgi:WD40 repeat protein